MPPNQRGRIPGSLGRSPLTEDRPDGLRRAHGMRRHGSAGRIGGGRPLYAQVADPESGEATDASTGGAVIELVEPEPLGGGSARLHSFDLPRFDGHPRADEMRQGMMNNCPVAATLIAMAHTRRQEVEGMIAVRNGVTVRSARRHAGPDDSFETDRVYTVTIRGQAPVQVSRMLYREWGRIAYAHSSRNAGWMCYIEKAYVAARARNSYHVLNQASESGSLDTISIFQDFVGSWDYADFVRDNLIRGGSEEASLSTSAVRRMLQRANSRPTIAPSRWEGIPSETGISPGHSYAVKGLRGQTVLLRDPRGQDTPDVELTVESFRQSFAGLLQASIAGQ